MTARFDLGRHVRSLVAAFLVLLGSIAAAAAEEEILSFAAAITVRTDSSVLVVETIEVRSEGDMIKRGILRDIFTTLRNDDGSRLRSDLEVLSVERDGQPEQFRVEALDGGDVMRIRIGSTDSFLRNGVHSYRIRYTMSRMARQFETHDELFWNVTGNYWQFPIRSAVASVTLPDGARITDLVAYTGRPGSMDSAATITRRSDTEAVFRSTTGFAPERNGVDGEGLTIAVAFDKGVLLPPSTNQQALYWVSDRRDVLAPIAAVILLLVYYLVAWTRVGRDPPRGTIIPLFHPPKGFSPALVHYVHRMGFDKVGWTAFTASLFDLGVKGLINISQSGKTLTVTTTGKEPVENLGRAEALLFNFLKSQRTVTVDTTNGPKLNGKRHELVSAIEGENRDVWFRNNRGYVIGGVLLSIALLFVLFMAGLLTVVWLVIGVFVGVFLGIGISVFRQIWGGGPIRTFFLLVWGVIFFGNMFGGLASWLDVLPVNTALFAAVSIVIIDVLFAVLLRAPTTQGRKAMDEIEGFKMYLETAEKERLNFVDEPPLTVERFERILPHAIALGVEKPWSQRFEAELARHAVPDAAGDSYTPRWYSGRDFSSARTGGFSNAVAAATTGMSAAMMSAQPTSSSSSGFSSSGGGSGRGGGGGGGGGW